MDYVIDCCVLKDASGEGVQGETASAAMFINTLRNTSDRILAVDRKGGIEGEYKRRLGANSLAKKFLKTMMESGRMTWVITRQLPKKIKVPLCEGRTRLHSNDHKYVETAYHHLNPNIIVYRESHWNAEIVSFLKKHGIVCKRAHELVGY